MKNIYLLLMFFIIFLFGCSVTPTRTINPRKAINIIKLSEEKEISVKVLETVSISGGIVLNNIVEYDVGLKLNIKNNSEEVKYLVWSSSSLGFEGITSRAITGTDRVINLNSIVPNTALMPQKEMIVTIYAADVIQTIPAKEYYYVGTEIKNSVDLILSYSGKNINELKQAVYHIELEEKKEKEQKNYMNSYQN